MPRTSPRLALGSLALALASVADAPAQAPPKAGSVGITVHAGPYPRVWSPIRFEIPADRLGPDFLGALKSGPMEIRVPRGEPSPGDFPAQVERSVDGRSVRFTTILPVELPAGGAYRFRVGDRPPAEGNPPWSLAEEKPGALELKLGDRPVFRYNAAPVSSPNYKEIQNRDGYLHPAYSPSGALITGDFSPSHPHHRGFFLAYERTRTGGLTPDFWNIHVGTGKIHADGFDPPVVGPVTARFSARHRWEARDKAAGSDVVVLRERWDVEAYAVPGSPHWLFDLTSTQQAVGRPLEVLPYRYGGMAYRGPEPFVKGTLDVLTSSGLHRKDGDQKPARWVNLTGPIADGSDRYAGAMVADHPANSHAPTVARIHPTSLPFFSYVPAYDRPLTIAVDTPTPFRYRVLIHDGRPDPALDERTWRDFADPPEVTID